MKSRCIILAAAIGAALSVQMTVQATGASKKPNVLFVFADQWRASALGYAGDPNVKTPNLDKLASQGVTFTHAVSGCPVCSPYRASLLTGQRPLTHGVFLNDVPLRDEAVTIAEVMGAAGYQTAYIGKWHLDGRGRSSFIPRERRQGFEYWKALECTHNYNNSFYYADAPTKLKWDGYDAIAQTRDAEHYVRSCAGSDKPFLLILSWGPPHNSYETAPERFQRMYDPDTIKLRPNVPKESEKQARTDLAGYYAHCSALDHYIGQLWQTLKQTGLEDNTIFVFTSDHGDMLGSHGQNRKQKPWDESVRVPLLVHYPQAFGRSAKQLDALINSEDLMPTLLGLCSIEIPDSVEGLDYSGFMKGGKNPSDNVALIACPSPFGEWQRNRGGREYRGIRTLRYTYVRDLTGPWLLFDNEKDPHQLDNLCNRPKYADVQAAHDRLLKRKLELTGDDFLPGSEYIKKWEYGVDAHGTMPYTN